MQTIFGTVSTESEIAKRPFTSMPIALVSARAAQGLDEDMPPLLEALRRVGAQAEVANWDDPHVDWAGYDLALLRSTWDASIHRPAFLAWSERVAKLTTLLNPPAVIRWNTDKHYLADLARVGVPTVPSRFIEPGEDVNETVTACLSGFRSAEVVVKPAVGSGSRDAQRHSRRDVEAIRAHVQRLLDSDLSAVAAALPANVWMHTVRLHSSTSKAVSATPSVRARC